MATAEEVELRPAHETVVDLIRNWKADHPTLTEIKRVFQWIERTKIPAGHDQIIHVIREYASIPDTAITSPSEYQAVIDNLRAQKSAVEALALRKAAVAEARRQELSLAAEALRTNRDVLDSGTYETFAELIQRMSELAAAV